MTETELAGFFGLLLIVVCIVLGIAALLMPIFVFIICGHCERMRKTLDKMEHMMRHGK
jgi:ABC-type tungstate transport system substrate-binding protein